MDMRTPPLYIKIMLESNPPKSTMLVGRLGVKFESRNLSRDNVIGRLGVEIIGAVGKT